MSEHTGGSYVTWRDLREAERDRDAELDRRGKEHGRQHAEINSLLQRAVELATENLRIKLVEENKIRDQILEERLLLANKEWVESEFAKMKASFQTDFEREVQTLGNRIASVSSSGADTSSELNALSGISKTREGRELGWRGAALAALVALVSIVVSVLSRVLLG